MFRSAAALLATTIIWVFLVANTTVSAAGVTAPPCSLFAPQDVEPNDRFGSSIGVDGTSLAAGSWLADVQGVRDAGSVTTFSILPDGSVAEAQRLVAGMPQPAAHFGFSVDLDGDILVVGAAAEAVEIESVPLAAAGAVYVYERAAATDPWVETARLTAADPGVDDAFGYSLEVDAEIGAIVVGAQSDDLGGEASGVAAATPVVADAGSAYLFERDESGAWVQAAKLVDPAARPGDRAGNDVAVSGPWIVVGHHLDDQVGGKTLNNAGGVLVYERTASGDSPVAGPLEVTGSAPMARDRAGVGVDVDGPLMVMTGWAQQAGDRSVLWVFRNSGEGWVEEARIELGDGSQPAADDDQDADTPDVAGTQFGRHVELVDGVIAVGASGDGTAAPGGGAVHYFAKVGGQWARSAKLSPQEVTQNAQAGISVGLSAEWAVIGAERAQLGVRNSGGVCLVPVVSVLGDNGVVADRSVSVFLDAGELEPAPAGAYVEGPLDRLSRPGSAGARVLLLGAVAALIAGTAGGALLLRTRSRRRRQQP